VTKIKIAIADDYPVFRDGLKAILSSDENISFILEADNGAELMEGLITHSPDIILMDLKMPVMGGMEATKLVREKYPHIKVLVISMYEDEMFISHLVKTGANGYLLKNAEPEDIRRAVYAVTENGYYFNEPIANNLLRELILKNNLAPSFNITAELTDEDKDILRRLSRVPGDTTISSETRHLLMEKTGVRNTAGLVMYALVNDLADE
jgi:DNA-binding NarL/FixJ family response regulator